MFKKRKLGLSKSQKLDRVLLALIGLLAVILLLLWDNTMQFVANKVYPVAKVPVYEPKEPVKSIYEQINEITGGENVDILYNLAKCESGLRVYAVGVNEDGSYDRGFYQINNYWHPEVPDHCAFDLKCSTIWTNNMIKEGQLHQWTCSSKI